MKRQTPKTNKTVDASCIGSSNLSEAGWSISQFPIAQADWGFWLSAAKLNKNLDEVL